MSINPQDPVVQMLKNVIEQYEEKMNGMAQAFQEALQMMAEGNAATFQHILQRISLLEKKIPPLREDTEGKEL